MPRDEWPPVGVARPRERLDGQPDGRPDAWLALDGKCAPMAAPDPVRDGQARPGSICLVVKNGSVAALQDFRAHAAAVILDLDHDPVPIVHTRRECDGPHASGHRLPRSGSSRPAANAGGTHFPGSSGSDLDSGTTPGGRHPRAIGPRRSPGSTDSGRSKAEDCPPVPIRLRSRAWSYRSDGRGTWDAASAFSMIAAAKAAISARSQFGSLACERISSALLTIALNALMTL